jgi:hypothetical protein
MVAVFEKFPIAEPLNPKSHHSFLTRRDYLICLEFRGSTTATHLNIVQSNRSSTDVFNGHIEFSRLTIRDIPHIVIVIRELQNFVDVFLNLCLLQELFEQIIAHETVNKKANKMNFFILYIFLAS